MTCENVRNRLLAELNPARVPAELRPHVEHCAGCRDFVNRYERMVANIQALTVPSSELAKIAFIDSLSHAGPIIRSVPSVASHGVSWKTLVRVAAKPLAGIAAAVAVGLGIWAFSNGKKPVPETAAPRHDLLRKVVATNASLSRTNDPKARIATLSDLAADFRHETQDVMMAAPEEDLNALAAMFDKLVNDGLIVQAKQLNPMTVSAAERHAVLNAAADKLAATADDASTLARTAPPQAKASLARIEETARKGRVRLIGIANGEGA